MSACELTCGLMLALARHVVPAGAALKEGRWERAQYTGTELYGKSLAVFGLGRVGREVAARMLAFGMKVRYATGVFLEYRFHILINKFDLDLTHRDPLSAIDRYLFL